MNSLSESQLTLVRVLLMDDCPRGAEPKTPNEIALTVLLAVLTLVFLFVVATLPLIANYVGSPVSVFISVGGTDSDDDWGY